MSSQSRVKLSSISTLTFYNGELTAARRTEPIPQLVCTGKPCDLYTPDVVRCENVGGVGSEIDWKCQADLPSKLRLGRTEVSCEGWAGPGDNHVLKGSCSLTYRLVYVPDNLHDSHDPTMPRQSMRDFDMSKILFSVLWFGVLLWIAWGFIRSCLYPNRINNRPPPTGPSTSGFGYGNWFGNDDDTNANGPPPPYTKHSTAAQNNNERWRPGFLTGAALGGLGAHMINNRNRQRNDQPQRWDWEQPGSNRSRTYRESSRGEESSSLGSMRTSTGMGGSSVR